MIDSLREFDQLVLRRLNELLERYRDRLPAEFKCVGASRLYSDSPIVLFLEPVERVAPANCEVVFSEINNELIKDFESHNCFFGLSIAIPHEYLDYARYLTELDQQKLDNDKYRKIRL